MPTKMNYFTVFYPIQVFVYKCDFNDRIMVALLCSKYWESHVSLVNLCMKITFKSVLTFLIYLLKNDYFQDLFCQYDHLYFKAASTSGTFC